MRVGRLCHGVLIKRGCGFVGDEETLMNFRILSVPVLVASALLATVVPEAEALEISSQQQFKDLQSACLREAKWPITRSAAYTHGDIRTKRQLANSSRSEVRGMQQVCRALASGSVTEKREAQMLCHGWVQVKRQREGAEAQAHAERVRQICESLNETPSATK